jgi:SAM-dependent methyltransferase
VDLPAERIILEELLAPRSRVLDVGTGATGRTALLVDSIGADSVTSIDINTRSVVEFARDHPRTSVQLAVADLVTLPFRDGSFHVVLNAFHGMDYVLDTVARADALREVERVLAPGGSFVVSTWNRLGILLSPRELGSPSKVKARLKYVARGDAFRGTLKDSNGLRLHQASLRAAVREIESATSMRLRYAIDSAGGSRDARVVALMSMEPYLVFDAPG